METHHEHSKRAKNAVPCTAQDITFGGRCLACGYEPDMPPHCENCNPDGVFVELCKLHASAPALLEALEECEQELERIHSYAVKLHRQAEEAGAMGLGIHDAWFTSHAEQGKLKARAAIEAAK